MPAGTFSSKNVDSCSGPSSEQPPKSASALALALRRALGDAAWWVSDCAAFLVAASWAGADTFLLLRASLAQASLTGVGRLVAVSWAVALFAGLVLALVLRGVGRIRRRLALGPWTESLLGAGLALVGIVPVATLLFAGTGISQKWYAPWAPWLVTPALWALTAAGLRAALWVARHWAPDRRPLIALGLLPLSVALFWMDRTWFPHQYLYLHWVLLLAATAALLGSGWALLARPALKNTGLDLGGAAQGKRDVAHALGGVPRGLTQLARGALVLAVPGFVVAAGWGVASPVMRQSLTLHTLVAGRLADLTRVALDWDRDHHSVVFGDRDCDNTNRHVFPFAPEVPGNHRDEDCDGRDATRMTPVLTRQAELDEPTYRQRLTQWRQRPPLAQVLARTRTYNIVLVLVDALRADQLADSAENRANHPHLMELADQSVFFSRAFSTGAGTDIGMATLFSGQLNPFDPGHATLLRTYRQAGFQTFGVFQREVERWLGRQFSLSGLSARRVVVNDPEKRDKGTAATSTQVSDHGIYFLRKRSQRPFFLWLHYFDVHEHHQLHRWQLPGGRRLTRRGLPFYRAALAHVDHHLGRFLQVLRRTGLDQKTIVVLASDHGEGLQAAPRLPANHGDVLFNPLVHVPLALRIPGVAPRRCPTPVSLMDVFPTLADLSGLRTPPTHGLSLVPFLVGDKQLELAHLFHPLLMYETRQQGIICWPWKLLRWLDRGLVELYNLEDDFAEQHNLVVRRPQVARRMAQQLNSYSLITVDRMKPKKRR